MTARDRFDEHYPAALLHARKLAHHDPDGTSEAVLSFWIACLKYDPAKSPSFRGFYRWTMGHAISDYLRRFGAVTRQGHLRPIFVDARNSESLATAPQDQPAPPLEELLAAVTDSRAREAIRRHVNDGEKYCHIAADFGVSRARVCALVRKARAQIARTFSPAA